MGQYDGDQRGREECEEDSGYDELEEATKHDQMVLNMKVTKRTERRAKEKIWLCLKMTKTLLLKINKFIIK